MRCGWAHRRQAGEVGGGALASSGGTSRFSPAPHLPGDPRDDVRCAAGRSPRGLAPAGCRPERGAGVAAPRMSREGFRKVYAAQNDIKVHVILSEAKDLERLRPEGRLTRMAPLPILRTSAAGPCPPLANLPPP